MMRNNGVLAYDAIIIGGGFYGCVLAIYLSEFLPRVVILERESDLLTRASYLNQARVHNGYHYPRSFMTVFRSFINFPRFCIDFRGSIDSGFEKVYAIARTNSKVNAYQFRKFCENINASFKPAPQSIRRLFNESLIEDVFLGKEVAFGALKLRSICWERIHSADIEILFNTTAEKVILSEDDTLGVVLEVGSVMMS